MEFDYSLQPGRTQRRKEYYTTVKPLISIITPFFNAGKYFEQTLNSVLNQTFPWFEWIIVDDGSTDCKDVALLTELAKTDSRIRVVHQANEGLSSARNKGFSESSTEIVVPLDADDLITPNYLENVYWALYFNRDADWCYTDSVGFFDEEYLWDNPWDSQRMKVENILVATAAIRKSAFKEIGGYRVEKYHFNEDWCFWLEMLAKHKTPIHIKGYYFWYRRTERGMLQSIRKDRMQREFSRQIIKETAKQVDKNIPAIEYPFVGPKASYHSSKTISLGKNYVIPHGQKKRIMFMIPWMVMGGADTFNLNLIRSLNHSNYEISVIATVPSSNCRYQQFAELAWDIAVLPNFLDPANYFDFLSYYIYSREIDLVLISNSLAGYYMAPLIKKYFPMIPIVDYVHMEEWYWKAGGYARVSGVLSAYLDRTYLCNNATRQIMIDCFNRTPSSLRTIHIGVDPDVFDPQKTKQGILYEACHISRDKKIVLFPCRLHPQKRPLMMLDIAEQVQKRDKEAVFVVVGDGELLPALKENIRRRHMEKYVFCVGERDTMQECYKDAYLTLICSIKEGLALTAYESCSMGVPVISSDVGGQKDLIGTDTGALIPCRQREEDIEENVFFSADEIEKFSSEILRFLSNPKLQEDCGRNCREKILSCFSIKKMAAAMDKEISDCIAKIHESKNSEKTSSVGFEEEIYTLYTELQGQENANSLLWETCLPESTAVQKNAFIQKEMYTRDHRYSKSKLRKIADFLFPVGSPARKKIKDVLSRFPAFFQMLRSK